MTKTVPPVFLDAACDVSAFTSDDPSRFIIQGAHLTEKHIEATNGAMLIRVPLPSVDTSNFPDTTAPDTFSPDQIMPVKPLLEALKNTKTKSIHPACSLVRVASIPEVENKRPKLILSTTDLENERTITATPIPGTYPNIDAVMPKRENKLSITLSADLLLEVAKYAIAHGVLVGKHKHTQGHPIRFDFVDDLSPAEFTVKLSEDRCVTGLVLPMRMV